MIVCQACGTENPPDTAYCAKCANKLDASTQDAIARTRAEHTATGVAWVRVVGAAVAVIVALAVVIFLVVHGM